MIQSVALEECPEKLQSKVKADLERYREMKILCVKKIESTPYKDKSIVNNSYRVYTEYINILSVYGLWDTLDTLDVSCESITIGDLAEFVRHSDWAKEAVTRAMNVQTPV